MVDSSSSSAPRRHARGRAARGAQDPPRRPRRQPRRPRRHRSDPGSISPASIAACARRTTCTVSSGGSWLANTEIPADRSNYGSFIILDDQAQEEVRQLIVAAVAAAESRAGFRCAEGRRLLPRLHGHRARRESRARAAARRAAAHRRDRDTARRGALHRLLAAHRRRATVRVVLDARQQEFDGVPRRAVPERAHDARPGLLPESRREVRAVPRAGSPSTWSRCWRAPASAMRSPPRRASRRSRRASRTISGPRSRTATR